MALSSAQSKVKDVEDASRRAKAQTLGELNEKERELQSLRTQVADARRAAKTAGIRARLNRSDAVHLIIH